MSFMYYNPNPQSIRVGDCSVRALSFAFNQDWIETYLQLITNYNGGIKNENKAIN